MAGRPRAQLSDDALALLWDRLDRAQARITDAREAELIDIYLTWRAGVTLRQIGEYYGVSGTTAAEWKDEGEQLHNQREALKERESDPPESTEA